MFAQYDRALNCGRGEPWLARPEVAQVIRDNLYHHHGTKYELIAYCIMKAYS